MSINAVGDIREDPFTHIQKMKGAKNPPQYTFRVGEYRVILPLIKMKKFFL